MKRKYTPKNWKIDGILEAHPDKPYSIVGARNDINAGNTPIAYVIKAYKKNSTYKNPIVSEETKANAYLIASAPELLEACKEALDKIITCEEGLTKTLKEAISKAKVK